MAKRRNRKNRQQNEVKHKYELPEDIKSKLDNAGKQERWIKRLSILIVLGIFLGSFAIVRSIESSKKRKEKREFVQRLYESMLLSGGYEMTYTLEVQYLITTTNQRAELHYVAKEETDQINKKKRITLSTTGKVAGAEINTKQIYYYQNGKCILDTRYVDDDGKEASSFKTTDEEVNFDYNPMLSMANMVMDKPGEFKKKQNTLYGSVAISDISTFLKMCPFNTLYSGIENLSCYKDQVNDIMIVSDGEKITSLTIDLKPTAWYLIKNFYEEQGLSIQVETYRITMTATSWEVPNIEVPEITEESEAK